MQLRLLGYALGSLVLSPLLLQAKPITQEQARKEAQRFLRRLHPSQARSLEVLDQSQAPRFYIFNRPKASGFILVNKDDEGQTILGYSTTGSFHLDSLPEGLRALFLQAPDPQQTQPQGRGISFPIPRKPIPPLLKSRWGQVGYPYNSFTPLSGTQHTPSGCVAVAMAQIMYHHRWPLQGKGSYTHPNSTYGFGTVDFSQRHYAWEEMLPVYGRAQYYDRWGRPYDADLPRFTSVSRLMADAGITVNMHYTGVYSGSFSERVPRAMQEQFDYSTSDLMSKDNLGAEDLDRFIEEELREGYPLYISGGNASGLGHAWVLDGMDEEGRYHMNFGWEGNSDGYYSLGAIKPGQVGSEFQGKRPIFTRGIQILALHPNKPGSKPYPGDKDYLQPRLRANLGSYIRIVSQSPTSLLVETTDLINSSGRPFTGDYGYGLYDRAGRLLRIYPSKYHPQGGYRPLPSGGSIITKEQDRLPLEGLAEGRYELRLMSAQRTDEGTWLPWRPMRDAVSLLFDYTKEKSTILLQDSIGQGIQPLSQALHGTLVPGKQVQIGLQLKNLTGIDLNLRLTLHLLDDQGKPRQSTTRASLLPMAERGSSLAYFQLSLPEDLAPGRHRLTLEATNVTDGGTFTIPVQRYELREDLQIQVEAPKEGRLELLRAVALADKEIPLQGLTSLDLKQTPQLRLRMHLLQAPQANTPEQELRIYLVDTETSERLFCGGTTTEALQKSPAPSQFFSFPLGGDFSDQLLPGRTYRLSIEGTHGEEHYELWPNVLEQVFLQFLGLPEPEAPTPAVIQALEAQDELPTPAPEPQPTPEPAPKPKPEEPSITPVDEATQAGPQLSYLPQMALARIQGSDLRRLEVYALSGVRLLHQELHGGSEAEVSLQRYPAGIYLVRIYQGKRPHTYRLAR